MTFEYNQVTSAVGDLGVLKQTEASYLNRTRLMDTLNNRGCFSSFIL